MKYVSLQNVELALICCGFDKLVVNEADGKSLYRITQSLSTSLQSEKRQ